MIHVRGRVRNGRLIVDEPSDLPEGTEVGLVLDEEAPVRGLAELLENAPPSDLVLSAEETAKLDAVEARGAFVSHEDVKKKLTARK